MAKVLVFGATGYIGATVTEQLAKAGVETTAFVRKSTGGDQQRHKKVEALQALGVQFLEGSLDDSASEIAEILKGFNTVLSFLNGEAKKTELKLVEAAKLAGTIKRFVPSSWGGEYPMEGKYADPLTTPVFKVFPGAGNPVLDALKAANIPYTHFVVYAFFGWTLPALGSCSFPGTPTPDTAKVYGDGNVPGNTTAEEDIGKVVAKAVNDPRTANKKLIVKGQSPTQNEIIAAYESVTGKQVSRTTITRDQLAEELKGSTGLGAFLVAVLIAMWFDGIARIPPEYFGNEAVAYASELYPDLTYTTVEDFFRNRLAQ